MASAANDNHCPSAWREDNEDKSVNCCRKDNTWMWPNPATRTSENNQVNDFYRQLSQRFWLDLFALLMPLGSCAAPTASPGPHRNIPFLRKQLVARPQGWKLIILELEFLTILSDSICVSLLRSFTFSKWCWDFRWPIQRETSGELAPKCSPRLYPVE